MLSLTTRHTVAGTLVTGVVLQLAETLLWPPGTDGDDAAMLRAAGQHHDQFIAASVCETLSWLLIVPALLVVMAQVSGRGRVLTRVGGTLFVVGSGFLGAFVTTTMNVLAATLGRQPDLRAATATWTSVTHSPVLLAFLTVLIASEVAIVPFAAGLVRAGLAPLWYPVLAALAVVGGSLTDSVGSWVVATALDLPFVLSLLWVGRVVLLDGTAATQRPAAVPVAVPVEV